MLFLLTVTWVSPIRPSDIALLSAKDEVKNETSPNMTPRLAAVAKQSSVRAAQVFQGVTQNGKFFKLTRYVYTVCQSNDTRLDEGSG